jgi:polysaccharide biosynthesis protein PslH
MNAPVLNACERHADAREYGARRILMVSTIRPRTDVSGTDLRCRAMLRMLASRAHVTLLLGWFDADGGQPDAARVVSDGGVAGRVDVLPLALDGGLTAAHEAAQTTLGDASFDAVFVFRPESIVLARPLLCRAPVACLDLDELGSRRETTLASAFARDRLAEDAALALRRARYHELLEREAFARFDAVFVSSEAERTGLPAWMPSDRAHVLPNVYPDRSVLPPDADEAGWRMLFLGKYEYYPNEDAIRWFVSEIFPRIRAEIDKAELSIVGSGRLRRRTDIADIEGVLLPGHVADLDPLYRDTHLVVIPLRMGCGTRLKLLEAMRMGRCVVSTSIGAEGLNVVPGVHLEIADDADSLAAACVALLRDGERRRMLAAAARPLANSTYDEAALARRWDALAASLFAQTSTAPIESPV